MEPQLSKGMIGIGWKFFPGGILIKSDTAYLYPTKQDLSVFMQAGQAAGGVVGGGAVVAGGRIADAIHRWRWRKVGGVTEMGSGDIKEGLEELFLDELKSVTHYIEISKSEVKKISRFGARTNIHHVSGAKYSITPNDPKEAKDIRGVIESWFNTSK